MQASAGKRRFLHDYERPLLLQWELVVREETSCILGGEYQFQIRIPERMFVVADRRLQLRPGVIIFEVPSWQRGRSLYQSRKEEVAVSG